MKILLLFFGALLLLSSCSDEMDSSEQLCTQSGTKKEMVVFVNNSFNTKARIESTYLPEGAEIGVFLRATDGSNYDGLDINNVKFTATGTESTQSWMVDASQAIRLSPTKGVAYSYFPWHPSDRTDLKIPITNDGTDWMYSKEPSTNLSSSNNVAQFELAHAMTIIKCKLVKGSYMDGGIVSSVGISGQGMGSSAMMDLGQAKVTDITGLGTEITVSDQGTLGDDPVESQLWVVSTGEEAAIDFRVKVDGNVYTATSSPITLKSGQVYQCTLNINAGSLAVSAVSVVDWQHKDWGNSSPGIADAWEAARKVNGVYAIDYVGRPIPYAEATADSFKGVAFVLQGVAYQVAKADATGKDGSETVRWQESGYYDIGDIKNYPTIDGVMSKGYISNIASQDPADWTTGALSDFSGNKNTEAIIRVQTVDGVVLDDTIAEAVVNFRKNEDVNEGYQDWFVPSYGQLAYIYFRFAPLNKLIEKCGGAAISTATYFSATEWDFQGYRYIRFSDGNTSGNFKNAYANCRLIRVIE